jgi:nucleoside-diphosphate-sugar epimerase
MYLITGCSGYIGRHLAIALLDQGATVRGLDREGAGMRDLVDRGLIPYVADVTDRSVLDQALSEVEVVYHLAGSALGRPEDIIRANVTGAQAVAAACIGRPRLQALVFAGSGALYPSGDFWLDEQTTPAPAFHYARAKYRAEQVLLEAHARHGLPLLIARIAAVYGPNSPALMVNQVRRGRFPLIGGGNGYASNIHIDDLLQALAAIVAHGRPGQIYNLADDEPALIRDFYGYLARLLQAPPPPVMPRFVGRLLVALLGAVSSVRGASPPLPIDMVDMASVSHRMLNRRMRRELAVELRYPSYRDGLPPSLQQAELVE